MTTQPTPDTDVRITFSYVNAETGKPAVWSRDVDSQKLGYDGKTGITYGGQPLIQFAGEITERSVRKVVDSLTGWASQVSSQGVEIVIDPAMGTIARGTLLAKRHDADDRPGVTG